jgi:hypothetical protein
LVFGILNFLFFLITFTHNLPVYTSIYPPYASEPVWGDGLACGGLRNALRPSRFRACFFYNSGLGTGHIGAFAPQTCIARADHGRNLAGPDMIHTALLFYDDDGNKYLP